MITVSVGEIYVDDECAKARSVWPVTTCAYFTYIDGDGWGGLEGVAPLAVHAALPLGAGELPWRGYR